MPQDPQRQVGIVMKCEKYAGDLADFVDGTLDLARQRELERHLEACAVCRGLVADLRAIQAAAFTLDRMEPPASVWTRIAADVETASRVTPRRAFEVPMPEWSARWMAIAAALLVATLVGLYTLGNRPSSAPAVAVDGSETDPAALVASVEADLQAAEAHYEKAIQGLELIAKSDTDALDPAVATVLQKNLHVIDQAIDESRAAVRAQPASVNAQDSLFDAMRNKVALLQQTVELVNEMRKGNQAEAGRIMQGLNQP